jgi:hypothetical protein
LNFDLPHDIFIADLSVIGSPFLALRVLLQFPCFPSLTSPIISLRSQFHLLEHHKPFLFHLASLVEFDWIPQHLLSVSLYPLYILAVDA